MLMNKFIIIEPKEDFEYKNKKLTKKNQYIIPINEYREIHHKASYEPLIKHTIENNKVNNNKKLVIRLGGIGDIISSWFPIIQLVENNKNEEIYYTCFDKYKEIFDLPIKQFIKGFDDFPININDYKKIIFLEDLVENNFIDDIHDIFASAMNVTLDENIYDRVIQYFNQCPKQLREAIGIQVFSNAIIRNYNLNNYIKIINNIQRLYKDLMIFILDKPDNDPIANYIQCNCIDSRRIIPNGCGYKRLSIKDSIRLVSQLKLVIAPDSSMIHSAAIYQTPTIGLYGPFDHKLRTKYYKNRSVMIQAVADCFPCSKHDPLSFCPYTMGEGYCLNEIDPEYITEKIIQELKQYDN